MSKTITFNELRRLKRRSLPDGSTHRIADELNVTQFRQSATISEVSTISLEKIRVYTSRAGS